MKEKLSPNESTSKGKSSLLMAGSEGSGTKSALHTPSRVKYNGGPVLGSTTIDIHGGHMSDQAYHCSASSVESLPSASGSSKKKECPSTVLVFISHASRSLLLGTQALVRPGSPNSSLSADDRVSPVCRAKAVVDHIANPFDKDALSFKVTFSLFLTDQSTHPHSGSSSFSS